MYWVPIDATDVERKTFRDSMAGVLEVWGGTLERIDPHLRENS